MTLLTVEDLHIGLGGGGRAVEGVSFTLQPGEVLALLGESGAGKSLTGAAVLGLLPPGARVTGGRIMLDGARIDDLPPPDWRRLRGRRLSGLLQAPRAALDPLRSVGRQLAEMLAAHRPELSSDMRRDRVRDWLEAVALPASLAPRYPHELTDDSLQRVAVALAMCAGPEILVADEPTTRLDVALRAPMAALLRRLAKGQGSSVLLLTSDRRAAAAADRVAVMYAGRLVEIGSAGDVLNDPRHPYAATLLVATPGLAGRRHRLFTPAGQMPRPGAAPSGCAFGPRCSRAAARCLSESPALPESGPACFHPLASSRDG